MEFDVARPFLFDGINHKFIFIFFCTFFTLVCLYLKKIICIIGLKR